MRVAIIGAGATGLCCARHFSRFPEKFRIQVFEQTSEVGGTWVYTDRTGTDDMGLPIHSSMYKSLRTNLPKEIMAFPGFPFKPHPHSYVHHWDVLEYLQQYSRHYQLDQFIKFKTLVKQVGPVNLCNGSSKPPQAEDEAAVGVGPSSNKGTKLVGFEDKVRWTVTSQDLESGRETTEEFDAVLVCNGHYFKPNFPDIPGLDGFPGNVLHSHNYREPSPFRSKRVLIVGAGPSGLDIMLDIAGSAEAVYLSSRHDFLTCPLPANIEQLPTIELIKKDGTVRFTNREERKVDSILVCTGYCFKYPFLLDEAGIRVENQRIMRLYKHTFNTIYPSMAFIGVNVRILPFPLFDLQVRWVLSVWTGRKQLPSSAEMSKDSDEDFQRRLDRGFPPHYAHFLGSLQWEFRKDLAELGGSEPYPQVIEMLYEHRNRSSRNDLCHYKDEDYVIVSDDKWVYATKDTENHIC